MSLGTRASVWSYRKLVWSFAERDLKSKYRGTLFGWVWALLLPLATVLIYTVVFSVVFRAEPPPFGNGKPGNYAVWLLVGLVTWSFFAVAISSGIPNLLGAGVLLQKVYIPSVIPVVGSAIATASQTLSGTEASRSITCWPAIIAVRISLRVQMLRRIFTLTSERPSRSAITRARSSTQAWVLRDLSLKRTGARASPTCAASAEPSRSVRSNAAIMLSHSWSRRSKLSDASSYVLGRLDGA